MHTMAQTGRPPTLTEAEKLRLQKEYEDGTGTYEDLAKAHGIGYYVVRNAMRQAGATGRRMGDRPYVRRKASQRTTPATSFMSQVGLTRAELCRQSSVSDSVAWHAVSHHPISNATAMRLYPVFKKYGYAGTIDDLFKIGREPGRPKRHTPRTSLQRPRRDGNS